MSRIKADNPLWILCCCGGLPIIALLKGLLCVLPFTLFFTLSVAATALFWLPHDVIHTYQTALTVSHVGPNLRALTLLLLPVPLLLWPPLVTLCTLILSLLTGLFLPAAFTFDDSSSLLFGGIHDCFSMGWDKLLLFWDFNRTAVFGYLKELRERPLAPGEEPFDVSLAQLALAVAMASLGVLVVGSLGALVCTLYLVPCTVQCFRHLWQFYREAWGKAGRTEDVLILLIIFPIWIVANAILPVLCAIGWALGIVLSLGFGVGAAFVSYQRGVAPAWRWMLQAPCDAERSLLAFLEIRVPVAVAVASKHKHKHKGKGRAARREGEDQYGNQQRYAIFVLRCIEPRYRASDDDAELLSDPAGAGLVSAEEVRRDAEGSESGSGSNWAARAVDDAAIEAETIRLQEEQEEADEAEEQQHAQFSKKKKKKHRPGH